MISCGKTAFNEKKNTYVRWLYIKHRKHIQCMGFTVKWNN